MQVTARALHAATLQTCPGENVATIDAEPTMDVVAMRMFHLMGLPNQFHKRQMAIQMASGTAKQTTFKRAILKGDANSETTALLQTNLITLVDLALLLKQAHWNVVGANFRPVHLQLDEIIESVRDASDEVAERISTLGIAPDGRSTTVAEDSALDSYPSDFQKVPETLAHVADALKTTIETLRDAIEKLGDLDPISEDLCIGVSAELEKHLWMVQAQEV